MFLCVEPFSETCKKIAILSGLPKKDFERVKVGLVARNNKVHYAEEDEVAADYEGVVAIGLDHADKGRRGGGGGVVIAGNHT